MNLPIIYEKITEPEFKNHYYAQLPTLGLTTHGKTKLEAKNSAFDLAKVWIDEKKSQ